MSNPHSSPCDCEWRQAFEGSIGEVCHMYGAGYSSHTDEVVTHMVAYALNRPNDVYGLDFANEQVHNIAVAVILHLSTVYPGRLKVSGYADRVLNLVSLATTHQAA